MPLRRKIRKLFTRLRLRNGEKKSLGPQAIAPAAQAQLPPTQAQQSRVSNDTEVESAKESVEFHDPENNIQNSRPVSPKTHIHPASEIESNSQHHEERAASLGYSSQEQQQQQVNQKPNEEASNQPNIPIPQFNIDNAEDTDFVPTVPIDIPESRLSRLSSMTNTISSSDYEISTTQSLGATPPPLGGLAVRETYAANARTSEERSRSPARPNLSQLVSFAGGPTHPDIDTHLIQSSSTTHTPTTAHQTGPTPPTAAENLPHGPSLTHTTITPHQTEITSHHIIPTIQPVVVHDVSPEKHFVKDDSMGELQETTESDAKEYREPAWRNETVVAADGVSEHIARMPGVWVS